MFACLTSFALLGLNVYKVDVEVDVSAGLPSFDIVGLPDAAVRESRDRVRSALKNCGYDYPSGKITINLAPADLKKTGPLYDLPILLGILAASEQLSGSFENSAFFGAVSLQGEVRPVTGALPIASEAAKHGVRHLFLPKDNAGEAGLVSSPNVYGIGTVPELLAILRGQQKPVAVKTSADFSGNSFSFLDFSEVKGQKTAKRALEVAAAGGHNALMIGAPGSGKSMLAKRLPSILPRLTFAEAIEITKIHSVAGTLPPDRPLITARPFRSPHHTVSVSGLAGGGLTPRPGEVSLAHQGVLFLDELPEFSRAATEVLRQPLENGTVTISRVNGSLSYPCEIMLVAAMNPCPCGYFGHPAKQCSCSAVKVANYLSKVSGPLLDRIDLHIDVMPVEYAQMSSGKKEEASLEIKKRVDRAREIQSKRYANDGFSCNARLSPAKTAEYCPLTDSAKALMQNAFEKLSLSARAYDRILKISRTIADLDSSEVIDSAHISEAIQYRSLDRKYWSKA